VVRRRVSGVHAVSRFMGRQIGDYVTAGLDVDTEVILNFRNPSGNAACYEPILADLPTEPFILYVGAFRRVKGIHVLLDSYSALRRPRPPLVLMGTRAPDTPARFPDGVHVLYDVPHHAVMWAWTRAMFGVFPSIWAEPLGNVVHEAMRQGRPVIGTRPGGHEDLIVDGLNGLLVAAGSVEELTTAMQHLADSSPLRERMGQAARIKADELHVDRVMPRIEALLLRTQEERR